jgi:hypothetical protein
MTRQSDCCFGLAFEDLKFEVENSFRLVISDHDDVAKGYIIGRTLSVISKHCFADDLHHFLPTRYPLAFPLTPIQPNEYIARAPTIKSDEGPLLM